MSLVLIFCLRVGVPVMPVRKDVLLEGYRYIGR
jgi:hypothetical protein